jgi:hypothetical protein
MSREEKVLVIGVCLPYKLSVFFLFLLSLASFLALNGCGNVFVLFTTRETRFPVADRRRCRPAHFADENEMKKGKNEKENEKT